ncbi:hypothetical protein DSO57_1021203 [Entomophthora muscae]|uniref:Uncharacterized protein n=1 Tax=Entomophthora muscae TaxID=34485 RepID=A0ACC2U1E0_9FUNG|nr:hypothetical protein DSO57_1021203 [Entomophthora muscae]
MFINKLAGLLTLGSLAVFQASPIGDDNAQFDFETGNDGSRSDSNYEYGKFEYGNDGSEDGNYEPGHHRSKHPHFQQHHGGHHETLPFVPRFTGRHGILRFIPKFIGSRGIVPIFNAGPKRDYDY